MKSNHKLGLMMAMFGAFASSENNRPRTRNEDVLNYNPPRKETESERAKRLGLKEWNLNGKIVYAATKKKALRLSKKD